MSPPRILVTGATGLVGSHAASHFRERGWRVRALVRAGSDVRHLERLGAEMVIGDVTEPRSFSGAAAGCDVALHAAAHLGSPAPWERYRAVNVEGTRHVLAECARFGVGRFVHVSSVAVYGPPSSQPELPLDEDAPVDTPLGPGARYERSKRMAETVVRRTADDGLTWTILRPAVVMGERDRLFTPRIARLAGRPLFVTVGDGTNRLPVVYAGNVARACWLAATADRAAGRTYNVADDGELTQRELFRTAGPEGMTLVPLPRGMVEAGVRALHHVAVRLSGRRDPLVTPRRVWFLARENPFRSRRVRRELGWEPEVETAEGWRRALAWHRSRVEGRG